MKTKTMTCTPGPWKLEAGRNFVTSSGSFYLAYGKDRHGNALWKTDYAELDANARLIAAAPLLAEAFAAFVNQYETWLDLGPGAADPPDVDSARAALREAGL